MISRNPSVLWTELDQQLVLLNLERNRYFEASGVGGVIWQLLEQPRSLAELVEHLVANYRVDAASCEADVRGFVDELSAAGLLQQEPADLPDAQREAAHSG